MKEINNTSEKQPDKAGLLKSKSKTKFETIFDESSLGNKLIDADLRIIKVNKALLDILGYSKNELIGAAITEFSHPDFREAWIVLRDELWNKQRTSFSIDTCLIKKDKSTLWCHVTSIIFEDEGKTLGYTIIEDISVRKNLEQFQIDLREKEYLIQQQEEIFKAVLNAQEHERERIAESLHNSIGQLLFAIKMQLGQVKLEDSTANSANIEVLKRTSDLLSQCMKECRQVSHQLMPVALNEWGLKVAIEEACKDMSGTVIFTSNIRLSPVKREKYFETLIYRMVQELMLNIGKHAEASTAKITITENEKEITIKVEDNGKGFNTQADKGIGLSIIKNNVNLLHGSLEAQSEAGKPTIITIRLPIPPGKQQ